MRLLPFGDRAVLAEFDTLAATMAATTLLSASPPDGVVDLVPAARTVLVRVDPRRLDLRAAAGWVRAAAGPDGAVALRGAGAAAPVVIPVRYDGPDLADAAAALRLSPESLVAAHQSTTWVTAFIGFAPGFAYLAAEDPAAWPHETPRRATSRAIVPAGSVGLAGGFSGVYPRASPGGWQLIGSTDAVLWDVDRDPPALLPPGTRVRFEAAS